MKALEILNLSEDIFSENKPRLEKKFQASLEIFKKLQEYGVINNEQMSVIERQFNDIISSFPYQKMTAWALRFWKFYNLYEIGENVSNNYKDLIEKHTKLAFDKLNKNNKFSNYEDAYKAAKYLLSNLSFFVHAYGMNIRQIHDFNPNYQRPQEIMNLFKTWEDEYIQNSEETDEDYIPLKRGEEVILRFPDGSIWVNLHKTYCPDEAAIMKHCGNSGSNNQNETVLSYRVQSSYNQDLYKPSLTFILDVSDGMLGEMKGRANEKPAEKYHPYILGLIEKYDEIKGIKGGGYLPENNFQLSDLDEKYDPLLKKIIIKKPLVLNVGDEKVFKRLLRLFTREEIKPVIEILKLKRPIVLVSSGVKVHQRTKAQAVLDFFTRQSIDVIFKNNHIVFKNFTDKSLLALLAKYASHKDLFRDHDFYEEAYNQIEYFEDDDTLENYFENLPNEYPKAWKELQEQFSITKDEWVNDFHNTIYKNDGDIKNSLVQALVMASAFSMEKAFIDGVWEEFTRYGYPLIWVPENKLDKTLKKQLYENNRKFIFYDGGVGIRLADFNEFLKAVNEHNEYNNDNNDAYFDERVENAISEILTAVAEDSSLYENAIEININEDDLASVLENDDSWIV